MARIAGVVVSSKDVILVEGEINDDKTVTLIKEDKLTLEKTDRHIALARMHDRVAGRLSHGIEKVILKASSATGFSGAALLHAAELRGVFLSAIPARVEVIQKQGKIVSRDFGSRKIKEYIADDDWWAEHFKGYEAKKGSREAAFLLITEAE